MKRSNKIFHRLTGRQDGIAIIYIIVMLIPNLLLACTEGYSFTTTMTSLLLPTAFYMLLMTVTRKPGIMMLISLPLMILGAFQIVLLYLFGGSIIAVDMFTNLFTTNATEAGELLRNIWPSILFVCIIYIPLIVLAVRSCIIKEGIEKIFRRRTAAWGATLLLTGAVFAGISALREPDFGIKYQVFPVNVIHNIDLTLKKWDRSKAYMETSKDFKFNAIKEQKADKREIYVLVIGEASRAASWSMFGYERETNPLLKTRKNLVPFYDMLTQANATHKSVPIILAPVSAENFNDIYERKSVITAFKEAGFKTIYISNQVSNRSLIDYFSEEADRRVDINIKENELLSISQPDGNMLPALREAINADTTNLLVIMHTYGSHFNYSERYSREFAKFTPDQAPAVNYRNRAAVVNAYDNSILYTDYVLNEIINILDSTHACTALLYTADHGEDIMDDSRKRFLHASPVPTYYQLHVAAFAWFSSEYIHRFGDKYETALEHSHSPATTGIMFHTLIDMASITTPYWKPSQSIVNKQYSQGERMYLNDHDKAIDFIKSGVKDEDMEQFDRHNIEYTITEEE